MIQLSYMANLNHKRPEVDPSDDTTFSVRTGQVVITVTRDGVEREVGGKMYFLKGLNQAEIDSLQVEKDRDARWAEYSGYVAPDSEEYQEE